MNKIDVFRAQIGKQKKGFSKKLVYRLILINLAIDHFRLKCVQNRFLSYATYILKMDHPRHDYSLIVRSNLNNLNSSY